VAIFYAYKGKEKYTARFAAPQTKPFNPKSVSAYMNVVGRDN
jgi:hypothetical protein